MHPMLLSEPATCFTLPKKIKLWLSETWQCRLLLRAAVCAMSSSCSQSRRYMAHRFRGEDEVTCVHGFRILCSSRKGCMQGCTCAIPSPAARI